DVEGLALNARALDRELLAWVERPVWDSVAVALRARLTDESIAEAVSRLPAEYRALRGPELERLLRSRREGLPQAATALYLHVARTVEIAATDNPEEVEIVRREDGSVTVEMRTLDEES